MRRITLLTDFGTADGYVAAMKGVIAGIEPGAIVDDVAHDVEQGDLDAGAWALARYWDLYPPGTVHVVVIDPGVGTDRRALAARAGGRFFVAPDNGVLSRVFDAAPPDAVVALDNPEYHRASVSATFHGRDIFAPAAAHLAAGEPLDAFGPVIESPVRFDAPRPTRSENTVRGVVVHVDRFGNLITNIPADEVANATDIRVADRSVGPLRRTYGDVARAVPLALIGSLGLLEVSVRDGSAAELLGAARGTTISVRR